MLNVAQFRALIVRPVLHELGMHSPAAENLVVGTALHESDLFHLAQHPSGPAGGVYQVEPATHDDLWENFLRFRPGLAQRVEAFLAPAPPAHEQLVTNLAYATAIARLHYWRRPEPLPAGDDVDGLASYWKQHFNTPLGAGSAAAWAKTYREFGRPSE